ncbi:MAG: DUF421 domain-containing protein [Oscillospiraceae bacterium]|nr:DUF421 domain-containing protein [Oscillospiraceae bacterium]
MQFVKVILTSIGSIASLFISAKIIGNKQMSELSMFDYINGITIGSIAAEMATSLDGEFYFPLLAIVVYTAVMWFISYVTEKNVRCRRFLTGRSILLMENGKLYQKNFKTAKIDINDFLVQCRVNGYFNLDDIDSAVLEQNGKISFLPKSSARPVTPRDMNLSVADEKILHTVILDGYIIEENLKYSGNNKQWLEKELHKHKIGNIKDVYFAECDGGTLYVYPKTGDAPKNDPFQ